ncbi:hypothetical protein Pyn_13124 [Prunus yedoensis var. nudiflora]|uniref:Pentatricopeptide repeat-containing protein n=1 Tax=Prunus yedoensis var. nudiflora TaxID=2094558 RepID=A0A314XGW8_PRUYE|nr:hypothetical protein Pyn_13124 [Prunus yedoensis var. nudiflora]
MPGMNPKECTSRVGGFPGPSFNAQVNVERMYENARLDIFVQNSSKSMHSTCGVLGSARKLFDEMIDWDVVSCWVILMRH